MIVAFVWLIISITINVTTVDNNQSINDLSSGALNLTSYGNELNTLSSSATTFKERFEKSTPFTIVGIVVTGIFGIAIDMIEMVFAPFTLISQVAVQIFGIPTIIVNAILTIIIISIIFGIWSVIKQGT